MLKSKKGFTVLELSIVIAITAIVITMACGFMIAYRAQTDKIKRTGETIGEINRLKGAVNEFIIEYDDGSGSSIEVTGTGGLASGNHSLFYDPANKELIWQSEGARYKVFEFEGIDNCVFSDKENVTDIIYCEASGLINGNEDSILIAFNIGSGADRERYWTIS